MHNSVTQALHHIASYQLTQAAQEHLNTLTQARHPTPPLNVQALFTSMLYTPADEYIRVKKWVDVIYRLKYGELKQKNVYGDKELHHICRQQVRMFIRNIVDANWKNQTHNLQNNHQKIKKQHRNININNDLILKDLSYSYSYAPNHNHNHNHTPHPKKQPLKLQTPNKSYYQQSYPISYHHSNLKHQYQSNLKHQYIQSDHEYEPQYKPYHFTQESTVDKCKNKRKEVKMQDREERVVVEETENKGHFLFGDQVDSIYQIFNVEGELYALIRWKNRNQGPAPVNSTLPVEEIRQHDPQVLNEYYQRILMRHMQSQGINRLD